MRKISTILVLALMLFSSDVHAQEIYILGDGSTIKVDGASNRSDWSVEATSYSGMFTFTEGKPIEGGFSIPVSDMKSGRSLIMDRLMHSTFDAAANPEISFIMESAEPAEEEGWWAVNGQLTMAGTSNPVSIMLEQLGDVGRTVRYAGSQELDMTEYGMKPPTAMFGSLHTSADVTIHFDLLLASTCEEECESDG
ncbi:MAG: YceI family protein [Rhodothermales bacterium]